ncbi:MAG: response regulator [Chloroflexaceae bacterium]|nr:response regulator [Chloroflexaceae bacterium]NJO04685.1 response regulator [Chloroflexaceae bacterium]
MQAKILVVDDEYYMRETLEMMLRHEGYQIITARNGLEALQRVEEELPDLILLDVSMPPGMDGYEVCLQLKRNKRTAMIPVTFLTAQNDIDSRRHGLDVGADDYLTKPVNYELLLARVRSQLRLKRITDQLEPTENVLIMLALAVEAKDPYTRVHLQRMSSYSEQLAIAAGLPSDEVKWIRAGGLLHDIGKINISQEILTKMGPLSPEEFAEVKRHPQYGAEIVAPMSFARQVAPIILGHHEHWDGSGYPNKLRGEEIPIGARIVSIVDAFDAMTTDRPYRKALSHQEALRRLRARAGRQWDPKLVNMFCTMVEQGKFKLLPDELEPDNPNNCTL